MTEIRHTSGTVDVINGINTTTLTNQQAYIYVVSDSGLAIYDQNNKIVVTFNDLGSLDLYDEGVPIPAPSTFQALSDQLQIWLMPSSGSGPDPASLSEVQGGMVNNKYVSPLTLADLRGVTTTSVINGCELSSNTSGPDINTFNISAGRIVIVDGYTDPDNPTQIIVDFPETNDITITNLATQDTTNVAIDSTGTVIQQFEEFKADELREVAQLGRLVHNDATLQFNTSDRYLRNNVYLAQDGFLSLGTVTAKGNIYSPADPFDGLKIQKGIGTDFRPSANGDDQKSPNVIESNPQNPVSTLFYRTQNGDGTDRTELDPTFWDDGGTLRVVPSNRVTVQRIFLFSDSGNTIVQWGQALYRNFNEAIASITSFPFAFDPNLDQAALRAYVIMRGNLSSFFQFRRFQFIESASIRLRTSTPAPSTSLFAALPVYDSDISADGDDELMEGEIYNVVGTRELRVKPVIGAGIASLNINDGGVSAVANGNYTITQGIDFITIGSGLGAQVEVTMSGGAITAIASIPTAGAGFTAGDLLTVLQVDSTFMTTPGVLEVSTTT